MTGPQVDQSVRPLYYLTGLFGLAGFVWYLIAVGIGGAAGFALGALGSFGNLWLFHWLSGAIAPGANNRKPWQAGVFGIRYILLVGIGYGIVKALGINPLAVILGLLVSTAATLTLLLVELVASLLGKGRAHQ